MKPPETPGPDLGATCAGLLLAAVVLLGLGACSRPDTPRAPKTIPLTIAGHTLTTELAVTPEEQSRGLMFRDHLPEDAAMLFVFKSPRRASFWMRNTRIPLSIAYISANGTILEIHDMQPFNESSVVSRAENVAYALETNQGWFHRRRIGPGDIVRGLPGAETPPGSGR